MNTEPITPAAREAVAKLLETPPALTRAELGLLIEALDSHAYWQLSDERYRDSGYVQPPGSEDPEAVEQLKAVEQLESKLGAMRDAAPHDPECDMGEDCTCG